MTNHLLQIAARQQNLICSRHQVAPKGRICRGPPSHLDAPLPRSAGRRLAAHILASVPHGLSSCLGAMGWGQRRCHRAILRSRDSTEGPCRPLTPLKLYWQHGAEPRRMMIHLREFARVSVCEIATRNLYILKNHLSQIQYMMNTGVSEAKD